MVIKKEDWGLVIDTVLSYLQDFNNTNKATLITLKGDLGSGKTTFTQYLCRVFGVENNVISPTFVIMKIYEIKKNNDLSNLKFKKIVHIDAYRLKEYKDLEVLNWSSLLSNKDNLIILEWPECVGDKLHEDISIFISHTDEETRFVKICYN